MNKNIDLDLDIYRKNYELVVDPTLNPKWISYCYNLPRYNKILQRSFIRMINQYTPLGRVPRCFDRGEDPIPINKSFTYYSIRFIKNKVNNRR